MGLEDRVISDDKCENLQSAGDLILRNVPNLIGGTEEYLVSLNYDSRSFGRNSDRSYPENQDEAFSFEHNRLVNSEFQFEVKIQYGDRLKLYFS